MMDACQRRLLLLRRCFFFSAISPPRPAYSASSYLSTYTWHDPHGVDMPRCTGAGGGPAGIARALASLVHGSPWRAIYIIMAISQCMQHAHGHAHACTNGIMAHLPMYHGMMHASIMHGMASSMHDGCMPEAAAAAAPLSFF